MVLTNRNQPYHVCMSDPAADPPDRGHLLTERRNPRSAALDMLSIQQTLALINTEDAHVAGAVKQALPAVAQLVEKVVAALSQSGRLIYLGAGTSGRLGVLDASECPPTFHCPSDQVVAIIAGGDTALRKSSEGAEDDPQGAAGEFDRLGIVGRDVVVGIAAGGTTPFVLGGLKMAAARGAATALICCVDRKTVAGRGGDFEAAELIIELHVGPEVLTGSTRMKAATATKMVLNMITTTAMVQHGKAWGNLMVDLRATNDKLTDRALRIICAQSDISRPAAAELLTGAAGRVKVALVMARQGVSADQAAALLDQHHQKLGPIIGPPRG